MSDYLVHYHMFNYRARAALALTTELTREAQRRHSLDPLTTIAVGRAISCAALLASVLKYPREYVHCSFSGDGVLRKVIAECNGEGHCRGYASPSRIAEALSEGDSIPQSVGEALGTTGMVTVTRGNFNDAKPPHHAVSAFLNGEIAADVARFLTESEQIPSAVAAGVKLSPEGDVISAGAVLVQRLAGAKLEDSAIEELSHRMQSIHLSDRLARGDKLDELVEYLQGSPEGYGMLSTRPLSFQCACSREKMANALFALGEEELKNIEAELGKIEIRCHYCSTAHTFRSEELRKH